MPIDTLMEAIASAREALDDVQREQNEDSDESNDEHLMQATAALDALEGHAGDLVP